MQSWYFYSAKSVTSLSVSFQLPKSWLKLFILLCILSCFLCSCGFVPVVFPFSYSSGISRESKDEAWGQPVMLPGGSCSFTVGCSLCPVVMLPFRPDTSGDLTREEGDGFHAEHEFSRTSCLPFCCALSHQSLEISQEGSRRRFLPTCGFVGLCAPWLRNRNETGK